MEPLPGKNGKFLIFDDRDRLFYADNWCNIRWIDLNTMDRHIFQPSKTEDLYDGWNSMALTSEGHLTFVNKTHKIASWSVGDTTGTERLESELNDTVTESGIAINGQDLLAGVLDGNTVAV